MCILPFVTRRGVSYPFSLCTSYFKFWPESIIGVSHCKTLILPFVNMGTWGPHLLFVTPPIPLNGIEWNFCRTLITCSHCTSSISDFDLNQSGLFHIANITRIGMVNISETKTHRDENVGICPLWISWKHGGGPFSHLLLILYHRMESNEAFTESLLYPIVTFYFRFWSKSIWKSKRTSYQMGEWGIKFVSIAKSFLVFDPQYFFCWKNW